MQEIQETQEKKNRKGMTEEESIEYRRIYRTIWERTKRHRLKQEMLIQQETSSDVDSVDNSDDNSVDSVDSVHSTHSVDSVQNAYIVKTKKQLIKVIECKNCRSKYIKRKPLRKASW